MCLSTEWTGGAGRHEPAPAADGHGELAGRALVRRNRWLGRRDPDPARLSAALGGEADRSIARLSSDERARRGWFRRQRLVAPGAALGRAQHPLAWDWGIRFMADFEEKR